jgi:hypothetical protein
MVKIYLATSTKNNKYNMEMFNDKVDKERIGPLKKNEYLKSLRDVERYFIRKVKKYNLEYSYDVLAQEMPYFKTLSYTEYATNFIMHPLNLELRVEQIREASQDSECEVVDFVSHFKKVIEEKNANKYQDRTKDFGDYMDVDNLVVLPGSNKLKDNTCLNKLKYIKKIHGDNVYFKPHPITTHAIIGEIKDLFDEKLILPRDIDLYYFLEKADKIYTTHISESAMYAAALGKEIEPIDVYNGMERGSFYHINKFLFENKDNASEWINKTFSSYKSGVINPLVDTDWEKKMDDYLEYIYQKRKKYQNWFIDSEKKKKK